MILVTGGSGFIGSHTVRALAALGESCVIIQRRSAEVPFYLADLPVVSEQADVTAVINGTSEWQMRNQFRAWSKFMTMSMQ